MRDNYPRPFGGPRKTKGLSVVDLSVAQSGASRMSQDSNGPVDPLSATIRSAVAAEIDRLRDELIEVVAARPTKRLIDRSELSQALGVSPPIIRRLEEQGMPVVRLGEVRRYDLDQVLRWLEMRNTGEASGTTG